jgi:hypothetical protein
VPKQERSHLSPVARAAVKLLRKHFKEQFRDQAKRDALSQHAAYALACALFGKPTFEQGRALGSAAKLKNSIEVKQTLIKLAQEVRTYRPRLSADQVAKKIWLDLEKIKRDSPDLPGRKKPISVRAIRRYIASLF